MATGNNVIETLVVDELGRAVLPDYVLDQIEADSYTLAAGGDLNGACAGTTNASCSNSGCTNTTNTSCTNGLCGYSTNTSCGRNVDGD